MSSDFSARAFLCASSGAAWTTLFTSPEVAVAVARIENHYMATHGWLDEGQLLRGAAEKLRSIPGVIVQGRYDIVCPIQTANELHSSRTINYGFLQGAANPFGCPPHPGRCWPRVGRMTGSSWPSYGETDRNCPW